MNKTSVFAYIFLALIIGYIFAMPTWTKISNLSTEKSSYEQSLATVADIENRKNELLGQYNRISAEDRKNIDTVLPNSFDFVRLISQIDTVAGKYGISIDNISSRQLDPSVGDSIASAAPTKAYSSAAITFSFSAPYDKFNSFMDALEKSLRLLDVNSVKISASDKGVYNYTVEFETYWLNSK